MLGIATAFLAGLCKVIRLLGVQHVLLGVRDDGYIQ
jgi:hypothetical protein